MKILKSHILSVEFIAAQSSLHSIALTFKHVEMDIEHMSTLLKMNLDDFYFFLEEMECRLSFHIEPLLTLPKYHRD